MCIDRTELCRTIGHEWVCLLVKTVCNRCGLLMTRAAQDARRTGRDGRDDAE